MFFNTKMEVKFYAAETKKNDKKSAAKRSNAKKKSGRARNKAAAKRRIGRPVEPVLINSYRTPDGVFHPAKLYTGGVRQVAKERGVSTSTLYRWLKTTSIEDIMAGIVNKVGQKHMLFHPRFAGCKYSTLKANILENGGTEANVRFAYKTNGECYKNNVATLSVGILVDQLI